MLQFTLTTHDHLLLDRSPNIGPLISRWELDKFRNCWNKSFRTSKILTLLYLQFSNLLIFQWDMSGPRLGTLSNNRRSGQRYSNLNEIEYFYSRWCFSYFWQRNSNMNGTGYVYFRFCQTVRWSSRRFEPRTTAKRSTRRCTVAWLKIPWAWSHHGTSKFEQVKRHSSCLNSKHFQFETNVWNFSVEKMSHNWHLRGLHVERSSLFFFISGIR